MQFDISLQSFLTQKRIVACLLNEENLEHR